MKQYDFSKMARCYSNHPALPLKDGKVIYGGSCSTPVVKDADMYIGFDHSMTFTTRNFPWEEGCEVFFPISDMSTPANLGQFKKLIAYAITELNAGKKVHVGCIGGHGRTGLFFAALVKEHMGIEDAITYVREHYCKKAVEAQCQVDWLSKNFGIKAINSSKAHVVDWFADYNTPSQSSKKSRTSSTAKVATPIASPASLWLPFQSIDNQQPKG